MGMKCADRAACHRCIGHFECRQGGLSWMHWTPRVQTPDYRGRYFAGRRCTFVGRTQRNTHSSALSPLDMDTNQTGSSTRFQAGCGQMMTRHQKQSYSAEVTAVTMATGPSVAVHSHAESTDESILYKRKLTVISSDRKSAPQFHTRSSVIGCGQRCAPWSESAPESENFVADPTPSCMYG